MEIVIRKMVEDDKEFIIELSTRFTEFEFMSWRDPLKMKESQLKTAQEAVTSISKDSEIFVAVNEEQSLLGFLHIMKTSDYFTNEDQAYISSIAVSKAGEGTGVGKRLMKKAEEWTKEKGYKQLVLNVFSQNERAVNFYSKLNFEKEIIKMVKEIV